jgi:nitrate/TMAO reductase-like tetraheme cytochrome c subunit
MHNTPRRWIFAIAAWAIGPLAVLPAAHEAMAEGRIAAPPNARWSAECGSCHVAYPAPLLSAQGWHRIMSQLDRHFGTDASLEPAAAAEIGAYLERYSGSSRRTAASPDSMRITETAWFTHEHHEVPSRVWQSAAVKSAANCAACHTGAGNGDFRERNIRIPR